MKDNLTGFLSLCLIVVAALACDNPFITTANISSLKTGKDANDSGEIKQETSDFKSCDTVYAVAQISNNGGKVKVKFETFIDDARGREPGETIKGSQINLEVDGDRPAIYNLPVPESFPKGRYKIVVEMRNEKG